MATDKTNGFSNLSLVRDNPRNPGTMSLFGIASSGLRAARVSAVVFSPFRGLYLGCSIAMTFAVLELHADHFLDAGAVNRLVDGGVKGEPALRLRIVRHVPAVTDKMRAGVFLVIIVIDPRGVRPAGGDFSRHMVGFAERHVNHVDRVIEPDHAPADAGLLLGRKRVENGGLFLDAAADGAASGKNERKQRNGERGDESGYFHKKK